MTAMTPTKICSQGRSLYENQLRSALEMQHHGKYLVLDVETGDCEVASEYVSALVEMQKKHEGRLQYVVRIGDSTLMRMGRRR
jgi:hypothetical protein